MIKTASEALAELFHQIQLIFPTVDLCINDILATDGRLIFRRQGKSNNFVLVASDSHAAILIDIFNYFTYGKVLTK